uniref:VWFA domain-containing protein n=1 Tax=Panagrolaimus sp. JU765 TaxID=591449 RepID=A0AC34R6S3_9BILA
DVQPGSKQHARFALASYGDTYHFKYDFLRDETRNRWSKTVDGHFVFKNFGFGVASNGLGLAEQILEVSSVDMNRVIILMTSVVTKDDVNHPNTRYIHDLAPVVFGIGFPDVNGTNHVAENKTNMVMIAQNRTEWVYDSIDAALASKTGILSQIVQAFPCNQIQCSGFIFI